VSEKGKPDKKGIEGKGKLPPSTKAHGRGNKKDLSAIRVGGGDGKRLGGKFNLVLKTREHWKGGLERGGEKVCESILAWN